MAGKAMPYSKETIIRRGLKQSPELLRQRAIVRQHRREMTKKEKLAYINLARAGLITVPQFAIEKYTVDLAIPDARIAIEIEVSWSSWGRKGAITRAKEARLTELGWLTIILSGAKWADAWIEKVRPYVEMRLAMKLG